MTQHQQRVALVQDLLKRMADGDTRVDSSPGSQTVSWHAHRDAEKLDDPASANILIEIARCETNAQRRRDAIFILGCLGNNCPSEATTRALLDQLKAESNKYHIENLLAAIRKQPKVPADPTLIALTADPHSAVRHAAILALENCRTREAEECLLAHVANTDNQFDLSYANLVLGRIGTERSIQYLAEAAQHKSERIAAPAIHALAEIGSRRELPVFVECLRTGRAKWTAMSAIERHGDETAIEPVIQRVKQILRTKRKRRQISDSELTIGLRFLARHRPGNVKIDEFFRDYLPSKQANLFEDEKEHLKRIDR